MNQSVWKRLLEPHIVLRRRYRRLLVLVFHGGYAALLVFLLPHLSDLGLQAAYFTLLTCWLLIFMATGFVGDKRQGELDERQQTIRNRAHRYAYLWLAALALIVHWLSGELDFGTLAVYVLLSYAVLPSSVIAWLEPDPLTEETSFRISSGVR